MEKFGCLSDLRTYLRKDRNESSLNPVRFINVETMEMWVEVKKLLLSMSSSCLLLSEFCENEDSTPNTRRLMAKLKASTNSVCVLPLSEHLRVNPGIAQKTILDILTREYPEAQNNALFRIYIPMYRMRSIFYTIPDNDPRRKGSVLLLDTDEESDYSLTIIQKGLDVELSGNEIYGFKKYLCYWEQNPDKPLILHTQNAIYLDENVFFDDVKVIVTSFDLLRFHYNLPAQFMRSDGNDTCWNQLAQIVAKEASFEGACCSELAINRYNIKLFEKWKSWSPFQKWLLWMWTRLQPENNYLTSCAREATTYEAFIESLFCSISEYVEKDSYDSVYNQRKAILARIGLPAPKAFWTTIEQLTKINMLRSLTDNTAKEREVIFETIQRFEYSNRSAVIHILRWVYPALSNYLLNNEGVEIYDLDQPQIDYFSMYRWYKATNNLPKAFIDTVKSIALEKGASVYALKARNSVVNEEYDSDTSILFVDGLGAEYIDYIAYVLHNMANDAFSVRYRVGYCNLPSTTENNKDFLAGKNVFLEMLDLDELKHGSNQYPNNVIQEMAFLDTLREKIEDAFEGGISRVILSSDHGTSRLAVLVRKTEYDLKLTSQGHVIYKYGRYCEGTDLSEELPTAIEYSGKLIFADYSRFEQKGAPIDEIHGGASLEEWLVPIIIIERREKTAKKTAMVENTVILKADEFKLDSASKMVTIEFTLLHPSEEVISVLIRGKRIICSRCNGYYVVSYKPLDGETKTTATVFSGNNECCKMAINIKRPLATNKNFDI